MALLLLSQVNSIIIFYEYYDKQSIVLKNIYKKYLYFVI